MGATFSRVKNWTTEVLGYADLNAEIDNILTNLTPAGVDDASANTAAMQATTDPGEVGTESLATSLLGEIQRLRFALKEVKGTGAAQWYSTPTASLTDLLNAVGGSLVNNRIVSGAASTSSNAPRFLIPSGSAATLTLDASPTSFVYYIAGTQYTVSADTTITSLSAAPSSNNTALVNDTTLTAQESSKWQGEDGSVITMDTAGSEITNLTGKYAAFKIVHGGNTEYFLGYVKSSTQITNCLRGCFLDSTSAPVNRVAIADNDTITLMNLTWVFVTTAGALAVSYVNPSVSYTAPTSTLGYWFDIANQTWKTYNGAAWVSATATLIGICAQDTSNCKIARALNFYGAYDNYSNVIVDYVNATTVQSRNPGSKIGVGTSLVNFMGTRSVWDITANLESGFSEAASTTYFIYVGESGQLKLSPSKPYYSADLGRGWYHPHENWRAIGSIQNDGSQNFDANTMFNYPADPANVPLLGPAAFQNLGLTASVASNALTITANAPDGTALCTGNPALVNFRSATATSGVVLMRRLTANLSITVPSSATLGHTSAINQYVWVYLVDDAGVVDIAVSGVNIFDDNEVASATAVTSGSTSGTVLYGVSAHTSKAIRLIGRVLIQEATAGTWASAPATVSVGVRPVATITDPVAYTPSTINGFGTPAVKSFVSWRVGRYLHIQAHLTAGTPTAVAADFSTGYNGTSGNVTYDTSAPSAANRIVGSWAASNPGAGGAILYLGSAGALTFGQPYGGGASAITAANGSTVCGTSGNATLYACIPIAGWSTYGPP